MVVTPAKVAITSGEGEAERSCRDRMVLGPTHISWQEADFLCMGVLASLGLTPPALSVSHCWMGLHSAAEAPQAGPIQREPRTRL